ncbi:MAG: chromosomal replication initiator protein DnaA [Deltaproteobacteria bacterium]|uniref:Chromosomal replication initiator protein DnaA n=1 Tax=Candidatus Zymogenus saltonus TaxID=2844893 RepID=A0A9D8KHC0_9DELT|nr:chromosomal replication initiator protein DnaA [Candidatus Zymogenus saltonus]
MEIWNSAVGALKKKVPENTFDLWFKSMKFVEIRNDCVFLEVPNKFFKDWISENYMSIIMDAVNNAGRKKDGALDVELVVTEANHHQKNEDFDVKLEIPIREVDNKIWRQKLRSDYTLANFVKGPSNEFAKAACEKVVENPAREYNPLFIYGGVGLGKTHLLNAIGHGILDKNDGSRVYYVTSEEFVNELVKSIRYEKMDEFRKKYRSMDILLVDDIQFFAGKKQTQEEFFHTFNTLYESNKQIVLTSDKITKEIAGLEERLRSRFEWGLIADIDYPDTEHIVAILKEKAEKIHSLELQDDLAFFMASIINKKPNIRELEGMLTRLIAEASLDGREITVDFARTALRNFVSDKDNPESIENIQKAVCKYFKIKVSDIRSKKRVKSLSEPRHIAMYLCREVGNASYPEIGKKFGGKDHSTVIHAVKKIEELISKDKEFKNTIFTIENQIKLRG